MAQFEGVVWADRQMRFSLPTKTMDYMPADGKVFAVSRSLHYGLFMAFEGIRFCCRLTAEGKVEVVFLNWEKNLERFRNGISFNLGHAQQEWVPTTDDLVGIFLDYFRQPDMVPFFHEMAAKKSQGYLRPFTVDEEQSIGVTFPAQPSIRAVVCRYDRYLGEPFSGVTVPSMVRAVGVNGTGCLKLGVNYLISVKAVDRAKRFLPSAASALFLDDQTHKPCRDRVITEWDSSCCLIALRDGTVVKIPESPLILPSVTIQGVVSLLQHQGITVQERDMSYGELIDRAAAKEIIAICSIGTAGILNRADKLLLIDDQGQTIGETTSQKDHDLFKILGTMKDRYWNLYFEEKTPHPDLTLYRYQLE